MHISQTARKFFDNREINSIITSILIFIALYISIVTLLGDNFLKPLAEHTSSTEQNATVRTIFILFILLNAGLFAVKLSSLVRIPPLFGCLALGIVIRNIDVFEQFFIIPSFLETMIRKSALVNIVIRWGLATDVHFLYHNAMTPVTIGLVTAIGEIGAVTMASYFILGTSLVMSVFCALILVIVSPAVTVPAMINFKEQGKGSDTRIPENILAVCCVDNLFCVIAFMILSSVTFTDAPVATTILLNAATILAGVVGGLLLGWLLWHFPSSHSSHTQFARITLLGAISISLMIGTYLIKYSCSGFVASLILSAMCAMRWSTDNERKLEPVVTTYKFVWETFALPLLFICLGLKFDFSTLTMSIVLLCITVITIGLLMRTLLTMLVTSRSQFNLKERVVVVLSLLPRATFQADLAPTLLLMASPFPDMAHDAELIMKAAIIAVLLTAPVFDITLNVIGAKFLTTGSTPVMV